MRIVLALLLAAGVAHPAWAQASIDSVQPFRPRLSVNEEAPVCDPFLKVWTAVFDAPKHLEENEIDLDDAYPDAWLLEFRDFYENPQTTKIDIDRDDELEVLYFDPNDVGWRYLGPSLLFFPSEKDFETVATTRGPLTRWGFQLDMREPVPGATFREIMDLGPIGQINLLQVGGHAYFTSNVSYPTETASTAAALFRLEANGATRPYCIVELLPAKQTFAQYRDGLQIFAGLKDVYGEPTYQGTMGWTANPKDFAFSTIL